MAGRLLKKVKWSGTSTTSVADAAVGIGAGYGVPMVADVALQHISSPPTWLAGKERYFAAGIGALASVGAMYWRGVGAGVIGLVSAVGYAVQPKLQALINENIPQIGAGAATEGLRGRRNVGLLTAHRVGGNTGLLQVRPAGAPARMMQGNTGVWGQKPFGGVRSVY